MDGGYLGFETRRLGGKPEERASGFLSHCKLLFADSLCYACKLY